MRFSLAPPLSVSSHKKCLFYTVVTTATGKVEQQKLDCAFSYYR